MTLKLMLYHGIKFCSKVDKWMSLTYTESMVGQNKNISQQAHHGFNFPI